MTDLKKHVVVVVASNIDATEVFCKMIMEVSDIYSEKVIEHFMCPQNAYSMPDANAQGVYGDSSCGDELIIFLKVQDNYIQEISYLVFGCCASIATSSMTSVLAKGKSLEDALAITEEDIIQALDGLPENKVHCSNLGVSALRDAINNYYETLK